MLVTSITSSGVVLELYLAKARYERLPSTAVKQLSRHAKFRETIVNTELTTDPTEAKLSESKHGEAGCRSTDCSS